MRPGWFQMPREPAAPWLRLPALTRALGAELVRLWQDKPLEGITIAQAEDVIVRAVGPDPRERKAIRNMVRAIVSQGLLVPFGGGVRLLYSQESYSDHTRTVDVRSTDGAPMVDVPSTQGRRKVDVRSTQGLPTVEAKPSESQPGTGRALSEEREIEERDRQTDARARVREVPPTAEEIQRRFRALYLERHSSEPYMGGKAVHTFADRLIGTAIARGVDPLQLLADAFARWAEQPLDDIARNAPYAVFAGRFGSLLEAQGGHGLGEREQLQQQQAEAMKSGDRERLKSLVAEERRRFGGGNADATR